VAKSLCERKPYTYLSIHLSFFLSSNRHICVYRCICIYWVKPFNDVHVYIYVINIYLAEICGGEVIVREEACVDASIFHFIHFYTYICINMFIYICFYLFD